MVFVAIFAVIVVLAIIVVAAAGILIMSETLPVTGGAAPACELSQFEAADAEALARITSEPETMAWISNGKPWDAKKVARFLKNAAWEKANPQYWGIVRRPGRTLVGAVGIHPVSYWAGSVAGREFVTIFVGKDDGRKGCGTAALREALARRWARTRRPVFADVRPDNAASRALLSKVGFAEVGKATINGVVNLRLRAEAPPAPPPAGVGGTFLILGKQLSADILAQMFAAAGWDPVTEEAAAASGAAGVLALEGARSWDKSLRDIRSLLRSRLDADVLTNKIILHDRLEGEPALAGIAPETVVVGRRGFVPAHPPGDVWIFRPEGGYAGRGIRVVEGKAALFKASKAFSRQAKYSKRALVSRYITNPKLLGGKKFHLRLYLVVAVVPDAGHNLKPGKRAFLCPEGDIAVAKEAFMADQYHVKAIHDTHVSGHENPEGLKFPADYPGDGAAMMAKIVKLLGRLVGELAPEIVPFAESAGGYEIFGVDMMVDDGDRPLLIEVNSRPGYALRPEGIAEKRQRWVTAMLADAVSASLFGTETAAAPVFAS